MFAAPMASRWVEVLLLRNAARTAASCPEGRRGHMRSLCHAGQLRSHAADELIDGFAVSALALYREAAVLYMAALLSVKGLVAANEALLPERVVARFQSIDTRSAPPASADDFRAFLQLLTDPDPLHLDRLTRPERTARVRKVRRLVQWLRALLEPRSVLHIRALSVVRVALFVALLVGTPAWAIRVARTPKNVALHAPVLTSSVHPNATCAPTEFTDGVITGSYGVHTNIEDAPWVQIDLGAVYRVDNVKIYNRGDGFFDVGLPMTLLFSENGTDFVPVDTRTQPFGRWVPWDFDAERKRVRYVRVNGAPGTTVALNEIEVFGRK